MLSVHYEAIDDGYDKAIMSMSLQIHKSFRIDKKTSKIYQYFAIREVRVRSLIETYEGNFSHIGIP